MQDKFEFFDKLPVDIQKEVVDWLPIPGVYHSLFYSTQNLGFFKPVLDSRRPLYDFLHAVVQGDHDKAKALLEKNIHLLVARDQVTDCSNRTFESISGFEYTLWALDKHMWASMLECIPKNEEGQKVFAILLYQYDKVNTEGVTYRLNGNNITEQHFDFKNTIIKELQTHVDLSDLNSPRETIDLEALDRQWREGVGRTQKLLPMHVVYEYCSNESFYPVPKFTTQPKSSTQFYNWVTKKYENWFHGTSMMFDDFAIRKEAYGWKGAHGFNGEPMASFVDLDAMKELYEVRTVDFINLKSQLTVQVTLELSPSFSDLTDLAACR